MDNISYFDLIVATLIILLGLKGIINGFFKEIFGMLGIVGGIFIGSTVGPVFGNWLDKTIFGFGNDAASAFIGFIMILASIWLGMTYLGHLFSNLSIKSGLGPMDKIFGFVLGAGKIFLIFAVIVYALSSVNIIKKSIEPVSQNSMLFPLLYAVGNVIIQIDPQGIKNKISDQAEEEVDSLLNELELK